MAVHIRHGAPGSFKTAAAVWFDILTWLREGRKVYTNIRGMLDVADIEIELKETFPDGAELIVVDTDSHEARLSFAGWFHWLPIGAAICIDEGQFIYPSRRDFKPESLDYPGGLDAATEAQRPPDIFTAIDKHRHYNWDVSVTTPNIKKLPEWLRGVVEAAYHHKNMEHIPVWGKRKARIHRHDPSTNGTTINKQSQYQFKRIPVTVHALYGSTITGEVTKNRAESNPLKNPRLIGMLGFGTLAVITSITLIAGKDDPAAHKDDGVVSSQGGVAPRDLPRVGNAGEVRSNRSDDVIASPSAWGVFSQFLPGAEGISVSGWFTVDDTTHYLYRIVTQEQAFTVPQSWLVNAGFDVTPVSHCAQDLAHPAASGSLRILCEPIREGAREPSERRAEGEQPIHLSSVTPLGGVF